MITNFFMKTCIGASYWSPYAGEELQEGGGKVALDAGFHELRVLYFEDYMGEALEVGVSSRKIKEAVLPEDWYYLPE